MNDSDAFFQQHIHLENAKVRLVPFSEEYEEGLRKVILDQELSRFSVDCCSDADLKSYINKTLSQRQSRNAYPFIVIDQATNEVAGATRYGNIVYHNKRLEIGWTWYGKAYRGTGINKACKYELLKYAFEVLGFRRVQMSADIDNERSQRAILKLGATKEGIFRANYINGSGESRDDVYFSIIYSEWEGIKRTIFQEYFEAT